VELERGLVIVQPDTLRWHRDLFRLVWRHKSQAKQLGGRRPLPGHIVQLIRLMARENPLLDSERIRGEMLKLKMGATKSSVQKYTQDLRRVGPLGRSWGMFLRITRQTSEPVISCKRMMRCSAAYSVCDYRIGVMTRGPCQRDTAPHRRLGGTAAGEARRLGRNHVFSSGTMIRNMTTSFSMQVMGADIGILNTLVEAQRANAFCERFLGSLRRECLDYIFILSECHLRRIVTQYVTYFNYA
jgi:putative transposase